MKKIIFVFIALATLACSNKEKKVSSDEAGWDITVSGKVAVLNDGQILIEELTPRAKPNIDSLKVNADGTYSKTVHLTEPGYYRITYFSLQTVDLVLDHANVTVNVDGTSNSDASYQIIGSPDYDLIRDVQSQLQEFQQTPAVQEIETNYQAAIKARDEARIAELKDNYLELHYAACDGIIKSLGNKPVNLGLINLLQGNTFEKHRYFDFYKQVADKAIAQSPNSVHMKEFNDMVTKMAVTAIGRKPPEISLPDADGKMITLSSFKGKYVFVDFWAYWCGPCRKENPNVVKAYNQFKDKGFEVLGVSLDRSKEDWLSAIKEDGLTWTNVSDLKYYESQAALDYHVNAIPFSVLLDPDGVIIANNLRGSALQKKLEEVFNKK